MTRKKATKTKNIRLRRQIRKTIGALFMASAVTVAALPVQDVSANPTVVEKNKVIVSSDHATTNNKSGESEYKSTIPFAQDRNDAKEKIVYTSGDGTFQFVYMRPVESDPNKVAVLLGYNAGVLMESSLTIPEQLEAYKKYTDNVTSEGYCLVSKMDEFLYYETKVQQKDSNGNLLYYVVNYVNPTTQQQEVKQVNQTELYVNDDGTYCYREKTGDYTDPDTGIITPVYTKYAIDPITGPQYNPCYYTQRSQWQDIAETDLYYKVGDDFVQAKDNDDHWKIIADVAYIGSEKIVDDGNGGWELKGYVENPDDGIFAGQNNITNLTIGSNIMGIGDFAFYGCSTLRSVSLANGLQTIGNGAFAECINLENCNIETNANIKAIGKDAFYDCRSLKTFTTPTGLQAIGDSCFEKCTNLETVDIGGAGDRQVALKEIGNHVFRGCSSLIKMEFPSTYEEDDLDIDMFEGCSSLQYLRIPNELINFGIHHANDTDYPNCTLDWDTFKESVPSSFYVEGPDISNIHDTAKDQALAFKYLNQDLYEKIVPEHDKADSNDPLVKNAKVLYQVNSSYELVKFWIVKGKPDNVTIPETIGPYGIASIGQGSFNDNCDLERITIPASVRSIGDNAFKGCHNLEVVIFTDASTMQSIGNNAFKTQEKSCGDDLDEKPSLTFVGAMMNDGGTDTVPFIYAMNGVSNINNSNQEKIWITCHSGWPTNLEVQYHYDPISNTGEAQLVGYPRYDMIMDLAGRTAWVDNLPYVTSANRAEYLSMVNNATKYYQATDEEKKGMSQPTENEMAIVNSTLNVVVPNSVDSIKPGLFSGYVEDDSTETGWDYENNTALDDKQEPTESKPDIYLQRITLNGVKEIEPYTFKNCVSLVEAAIIGPTYIGDYAFDGADDDTNFTGLPSGNKEMQLQSATLGTNLTDTGKRPFRGCPNLTSVTCLDSDFAYDNGVIYRNTGNGYEVVQCLEGRGKNIGSYSVGPDELAGVVSLKEEAFAGCGDVGKVDLSSSTIDVVPEGCFKETDDLNSVVLPDTVKNIEAESFRDSAIRLLTIPGTQAYIAKDAFATSKYLESGNHSDQQTIIFECIEGTTADRYAKETENWYINPEYGKVYLTHTVYFWDYPDYPDITKKEIFDKVKVNDGEDAVPPTKTPEHVGYQFNRWTDYTNIVRDTDVYPIFGNNIYAVSFRDYDGSLIGEVQYIEEGKSATPPANPTREGYTFDKWSQDWNNVTEDRTIIALYTDNSSDASRHTVIFYDYDGTTVISQQSVNDGEAAVEPKSPTRSGYTFTGWVPKDFTKVTKDMNIVASYEKNSDSNNNNNGNNGNNSSKSSASPSPTASPGAGDSTKKYTVSVSGGSGSGSYAAGAVVAINAYFMGDGQTFDKWTTSTAGVGFANASASSTTFTMPAANVAITATYKAGKGTAATGNGGSSSNGNSSNGAANTGNNSGTVVEITKPGVSNTGLAGATVTGATDNFVVKITEDQSATDAVTAALQAEYGDISRIQYFPMDISLYDSTGRTKIADTTGISVNITMPIPDELVQYAGNNKAGAVANGSLENLGVKFTTVNGVPCINFTATHFSPYTIYVNTASLTASGTIDSTPKTGDPIHPKWFLAIGMACISLVLFFKKDRVYMKKAG